MKKLMVQFVLLVDETASAAWFYVQLCCYNSDFVSFQKKKKNQNHKRKLKKTKPQNKTLKNPTIKTKKTQPNKKLNTQTSSNIITGFASSLHLVDGWMNPVKLE